MKKSLIGSFLDNVKKILSKIKTYSNKENAVMKKKETIISALEKIGCSPEVDDDGDIMFRYQMKTVYAMVGDEEEQYVSMMLPQFNEIEEGQDALVLAVCNKMTRELKIAKVYIDQTFKNVTATCEFYYANEESLEQNLRNSLQMLGVVRTVFRNNMADLAEE